MRYAVHWRHLRADDPGLFGSGQAVHVFSWNVFSQSGRVSAFVWRNRVPWRGESSSSTARSPARQ